MRLVLAYALLLGAGCILEDNPLFVDAHGQSSGDEGAHTGGSTSTSADPSADDTTSGGGTDDDDGSGTGGPIGTEGPGCDDPALCRTLHIGVAPGGCPHEVDGVPTSECDEVGLFALRVATETLAYYDETGLIIMYDDNGTAADYVGSVEVPAETTIRAADGVEASDVVVWHQGDAGVFRFPENGAHLHGFTIACTSGCEWALRTRADPEVAGSETSGHLFENLVIAATRPEHAGSNSTLAPIESLGPDTIVRNSHIWGHFEGAIDLRFAVGSAFVHNTVLWYGSIDADAPLDARAVDGLEVSNNVFVSLTAVTPALIVADDGTKDLVAVGNVAERFGQLVSGVVDGDPDIDTSGSILGPFEADSPRSPLFLSDTAATASATAQSAGLSLDGVRLEEADALLPGAFQERSGLSLPRRTVITVGDGTCAGRACDIDKGLPNELQFAVHSAWPGTVVQIHPSATPYAGPVVISWPLLLQGQGDDPEAVQVEVVLEDPFLEDYGHWAGAEFSVVDVLADADAAISLDNFTILARNNDIGLTHEGNSGSSQTTQHEVSRLIVRDSGALMKDQTANTGLYFGDGVLAHDVLVHGGFRSCARFGPRPFGSAVTPSVTAYIYNITCRLTVPLVDPATLAAFEIAAVDGVIIANAAVDLAQIGVLFRAQRRTNGDDDPDNALDKPVALHAEAISARGIGPHVEGFSVAEGTYTEVALDEPALADPFFVSATDSHLDPLAAAYDTGIDPADIDTALFLGVSINGVDRSRRVVDRGGYEQGP